MGSLAKAISVRMQWLSGRMNFECNEHQPFKPSATSRWASVWFAVRCEVAKFRFNADWMASLVDMDTWCNIPDLSSVAFQNSVWFLWWTLFPASCSVSKVSFCARLSSRALPPISWIVFLKLYCHFRWLTLICTTPSQVQRCHGAIGAEHPGQGLQVRGEKRNFGHHAPFETPLPRVVQYS